MIEIRDLSVDYVVSGGGRVRALRSVSLSLSRGESAAVVGESGCGKSTLALALIGLLPVNAETKGCVEIGGVCITGKKHAELAGIRGKQAGMIFQEPSSSLNPVFTVKEQIEETIIAHEPSVDRKSLGSRGRKLLEEAGITDIDRVYNSYPHQLSGGQQQRVMAAIALSCNPGLLIADEPTTALDVTVQAQIIELLKRLKKERELTLLLITHDLHLGLELCSRVIVMYAGEVVEDAVMRGEKDAAHPYTRALFEVIPRIGGGKSGFRVIPGELPEPGSGFEACAFAPRCSRSQEKCFKEHPEMEPVPRGMCRCFFPYTDTEALKRRSNA